MGHAVTDSDGACNNAPSIADNVESHAGIALLGR
jgi:hypothetical protein